MTYRSFPFKWTEPTPERERFAEELRTRYYSAMYSFRLPTPVQRIQECPQCLYLYDPIVEPTEECPRCGHDLAS